MIKRARNSIASLAASVTLLSTLGVLAGAMLANGDGGAGDGGASGEGGEPKPAPEAEPKPDPKNGEPAPGTVTMSQTELDALINKAHGKAKATSEAEFKKWLNDQALSETDRLKVERDELAKQREDDKAEILTTKIETVAERAAVKAGVNPDRIERFMRTVDLTSDDLSIDGKPDPAAIAKAVASALIDVPEFAGKAGVPKPGSSGGEFNAGNDGKVWTRDEIAKLTPAEYEKHEPEIMAQMKAGGIAR